jgi:DNA-directed RNA polymerase sigma subunit (sigma70/sigma32)
MNSKDHLIEATRAALDSLPAIEAKVLRARYLGPHTARVEDVAKEFALTPQRVLEIEADALRRMREAGVPEL